VGREMGRRSEGIREYAGYEYVILLLYQIELDIKAQ
jgi:hypothetical protein